MEKLRDYLNGLDKSKRAAYVQACGTTEGYLRKAISARQKLGADLCIALERESGGVVPCESLRPDVDWAYIRASAKQVKQRDPLVDSPTEQLLQLPNSATSPRPDVLAGGPPCQESSTSIEGVRA